MNTITTSSDKFTNRVEAALADEDLKKALSVIKGGFVEKRRKAIADCPDFSSLSDKAIRIKNHTLANLDHYLERFEENMHTIGGHLHFAETGEDACEIIKSLCKSLNAKKIVKSKSMVGEEIGLTQCLEEAGYKTVETDLGEYLIQLRNEMPSHIIAPALHLTRSKIRDDFKRAHEQLDKNRQLETPEEFVKEARQILREQFLSADIGITGANFLIANTGSTIMVTNEGNGDLCQTLPKVHIVIASIEKLVPGLDEAAILLRLLARSATGQAISTYTSFTSGPKRDDDPDGPEEFHVILLDNGRSEMIGSEFHEMLRCIKCGACMNHCPIYQNIGGHAYGTVYPGPMGSVLSPKFFGLKQAGDFPHASSFCGRCVEVCPMQIPLTKLMRYWREKTVNDQGVLSKMAMSIWANLAKHPKSYNAAMKVILPIANKIMYSKYLLKQIPGIKQWTRHREFPKLASVSFQHQWRKRSHDK